MRLTSIERALKLIDYLGQKPGGASLSEIAAGLDQNKSTIHHILSTLAPYDYVIQNRETKKYSLGFKFLALSRGILDGLDLRRIAQPHLRALHEACGEAVHLAVLRGDMIIYIDKIAKPGGLQLATYIGFSTEAHAAAGGKALLAALSDREVRELYRGKKFKVYSERTITDLDQLLDELGRVRARGYALDDEEYYEGARCVAAAIMVGGQAAAALSVTGSIFTITKERIDRTLAAQVREAADRISAEMHW